MTTAVVTPTPTTPTTPKDALRKCDPSYIAALDKAFKQALYGVNGLYFLLGRDGATGFDSEETDAFLASIENSDDVEAIENAYTYFNWDDMSDVVEAVHAENNRKAARARRLAKANRK